MCMELFIIPEILRLETQETLTYSNFQFMSTMKHPSEYEYINKNVLYEVLYKTVYEYAFEWSDHFSRNPVTVISNLSIFAMYVNNGTYILMNFA